MDRTSNRFNPDETEVHTFVFNYSLAGHVLTLALRTVVETLVP